LSVWTSISARPLLPPPDETSLDQPANDAEPCFFRQRLDPERNLKDLFKIVMRRRLARGTGRFDGL
jgi:hypothetical protein